MGLRFILECLENSLKYGLIFFGLCSSNLHTMQVHTHTYTLIPTRKHTLTPIHTHRYTHTDIHIQSKKKSLKTIRKICFSVLISLVSFANLFFVKTLQNMA